MKDILWPKLDDRRVLLAVSGGIAAYKAVELCRLITRCGGSVQVMMTEAAREFVGPTTFAAVSGNAVATAMFTSSGTEPINHIRLADEADLLVAAPATADLLAKFAGGLANDLVSTVYLAHHRPVLLAPAMNVHMWAHEATQQNIDILRRRNGHHLVGPEQGEMACGHVGPGRMAEPTTILQAIGGCLAPQDLAGKRVLVSAGPTHEPIDPVRFIGNRSSGKMGYAIAADAAQRGAHVTLVSGPTALPAPYGVTLVRVREATEMAQAVADCADEQDVIVMAAAVADYRPKMVSQHKLKKDSWGDQPTIELKRNIDILAQLGKKRTAGSQHSPILVGFAAESEGENPAAWHAKRQTKACDLLVVNIVSQPGVGFDVDTNQVTLVSDEAIVGPETTKTLPLTTKRETATQIIDWVVHRLKEVDSLGCGSRGGDDR